ncbi:unnamed protein product [Amoebophrya sp. A120]|nr:unnamed protein product [Amoebophrya sp. A120]|eukprot:GSA120T00024755001.1
MSKQKQHSPRVDISPSTVGTSTSSASSCPRALKIIYNGRDGNNWQDLPSSVIGNPRHYALVSEGSGQYQQSNLKCLICSKVPSQTGGLPQWKNVNWDNYHADGKTHRDNLLHSYNKGVQFERRCRNEFGLYLIGQSSWVCPQTAQDNPELQRVYRGDLEAQQTNASHGRCKSAPKSAPKGTGRGAAGPLYNNRAPSSASSSFSMWQSPSAYPPSYDGPTDLSVGSGSRDSSPFGPGNTELGHSAIPILLLPPSPPQWDGENCPAGSWQRFCRLLTSGVFGAVAGRMQEFAQDLAKLDDTLLRDAFLGSESGTTGTHAVSLEDIQNGKKWYLERLQAHLAAQVPVAQTQTSAAGGPRADTSPSLERSFGWPRASNGANDKGSSGPSPLPASTGPVAAASRSKTGSRATDPPVGGNKDPTAAALPRSRGKGSTKPSSTPAARASGDVQQGQQPATAHRKRNKNPRPPVRTVEVSLASPPGPWNPPVSTSWPSGSATASDHERDEVEEPDPLSDPAFMRLNMDLSNIMKKLSKTSDNQFPSEIRDWIRDHPSHGVFEKWKNVLKRERTYDDLCQTGDEFQIATKDMEGYLNFLDHARDIEPAPEETLRLMRERLEPAGLIDVCGDTYKDALLYLQLQDFPQLRDIIQLIAKKWRQQPRTKPAVEVPACGAGTAKSSCSSNSLLKLFPDPASRKLATTFRDNIGRIEMFIKHIHSLPHFEQFALEVIGDAEVKRTYREAALSPGGIPAEMRRVQNFIWNRGRCPTCNTCCEPTGTQCTTHDQFGENTRPSWASDWVDERCMAHFLWPLFRNMVVHMTCLAPFQMSEPRQFRRFFDLKNGLVTCLQKECGRILREGRQGRVPASVDAAESAESGRIDGTKMLWMVLLDKYPFVAEHVNMVRGAWKVLDIPASGENHYHGRSELHIAAWEGSQEQVRRVLQKYRQGAEEQKIPLGIFVEYTNSFRMTALQETRKAAEWKRFTDRDEAGAENLDAICKIIEAAIEEDE